MSTVCDDPQNQQLSLRWNNYLRRVTRSFDALRSQGDLVDVTLCCEGKKINAHKMLLSACSPYFKEIFKENPCRHPVIIFRNVKFDDLNAIIYFIYHGEVNVSQDQLASFLITAEMLQIQGLTETCDDADDGMQGKRARNTEVSNVEASDPKRQKVYVQDDDLDDKSNISSVIPYTEVEIVSTPAKIENSQKPETNKSTNSRVLKINNVDNEIVSEEAPIEETRILDRSIGVSISTDISATDEQTAASSIVKFRCHVCWKGFKHPTSLTLHKDAHTGKTQCPVCRRSFSRSYDMRNHLQRIHQDKSTAE